MTVLRRFLPLFLLSLLLLSCNQEIIDFFEAIQDYGYRSTQPLGPNKIPVNQDLLGGYVYDELPVVISKKDETTYEIKFLSVLLHKEDAKVNAHATQIGASVFLNLDMGDYYCFMRVNLFMNQQLQIDLLKDAFREYVGESELKNWFEKNPGATSYKYKENDMDYSLDIYFSFIFDRITIDEALRIQQNRLRMERKAQFEYCETYQQYEELIKMFPGDEFIPLAEKSLFYQCETVDDYKKFISYFPNSSFIPDAQNAIVLIQEQLLKEQNLINDKNLYSRTLKENTIDAWETFLGSALTQEYKDSALYRIELLASAITQHDVEWKWTNGQPDKAFNLLHYKIKFFSNTNDADWVIELLTLYTLKSQNDSIGRSTLLYFDLLAKERLANDDYLNLYISKGFVLWSLSEFDLCISTFSLKLGDLFDSDNRTVKEHIKDQYEKYIGMGIVFPNQKNMWKEIKKLKSEG